MATVIYRCNGQYFGYLEAGNLYNPEKRYLGWCENNLVYTADGNVLGELHQDQYVVRTGAILQNKIPRVPGISMNPPPSPSPSLPIRLPVGWEDALENLGRMPNPEQIPGLWQHNQGVLEFGADGLYFHQNEDDPSFDISGTWQLRANMLSVNVSELSDPVRRFRIMEFSDDRLTLRILSDSERSIPFTLQRVGPCGHFERPEDQADNT